MKTFHPYESYPSPMLSPLLFVHQFTPFCDPILLHTTPLLSLACSLSQDQFVTSSLSVISALDFYLRPPRRLYNLKSLVFVHLFVCEQHNSKPYWWIYFKFANIACMCCSKCWADSILEVEMSLWPILRQS